MSDGLSQPLEHIQCGRGHLGKAEWAGLRDFSNVRTAAFQLVSRVQHGQDTINRGNVACEFSQVGFQIASASGNPTPLLDNRPWASFSRVQANFLEFRACRTMATDL
ncbi:hypothetical protein [Acidisphaera sp. S103]|uniref:hypothetical protein n=1 Tax=Acidisphaera sp. S103 TaxID=1747223 RepID=UPI00131B14E8|nr:hypothetical protein [Acidisphaera sp. S103]